MKKLLIIAGTANDVFIYKMSMWLKKSMDIDIDIYEFYPSVQQQQDVEKYANVYSSNIDKWFCKIKGIGYSLMQVYSGKQLGTFLQSKEYDYIHCHWLVSSLVINNGLKKHCKKLYVTFWGGEVFVQKIMLSHSLYMMGLKRLLKETDNIVGYFAEREFYEKLFTDFKGRYLSANLAPTILEDLYDLMKVESKDISKEKLGVTKGKKLVLIGYSGKSIHQHLEIIKELSHRDELKSKLCLLAPMTRGASPNYVTEVECSLKNSGFEYILYKNQFFTEEMMARLRNATDITLQLSTRDAYSRSIIECLCAKSVLIYADWLKYDPFFAYDGFEAIKVKSIHHAVDKLAEITDSLSDFERVVEKNSINGKRHNLWSECIHEWVNLYK